MSSTPSSPGPHFLPEPHFMSAEATRYEFICPDCVHEKNIPGGAGWTRTEGHVMASGDFPADKDNLFVKCHRGHGHFVIREGSELAANFGHA